jgi:hypothetical protein
MVSRVTIRRASPRRLDYLPRAQSRIPPEAALADSRTAYISALCSWVAYYHKVICGSAAA